MADIRVRMYNVGFGDCFLLEFPRDRQAPFRILVDCGAHRAGYPQPGWTIGEVVDAIIEDISDDQPALGVVVASHRHQDHVSGFESPAWNDVAVDEVWLPWTEDPNDTVATRIRNRQSGLALTLDTAFTDPQFDLRWNSGAIKDSLRAMVANSLTNQEAMRTLHHGFTGKPRRRFLSRPRTGTLQPPQCPGLTVHVLGPSRDEATIRDMDPPSSQSYLRLASAPLQAAVTNSYSAEVSESQRPFAGNFVIDAQNYAGPVLDAEVKNKAAGIMNDHDVVTAVSLDKAVNGTSLMFMFEFGSAYLLFPGDAQWGTWNAVLQQPSTRELLSRTTFYKVGHHGSHNATPKEFLEEVLDPGHMMWAAATSVHPISFWPEIPRDPLMTALGQHASRVLRSDQPSRNRSGVNVRSNGRGVDFRVPC